MVERRTPEREVGGLKPTSAKSMSKTLYSPKVLVILSKRWLPPDMTEKMLTVTLNHNTNKNFLNSKFRASSYLLLLYSPVYAGPGQKQGRQVFSRCGSYGSFKTNETASLLFFNFNFHRRSPEGYWFLLQMYLLVWGTRRRARKKGKS